MATREVTVIVCDSCGAEAILPPSGEWPQEWFGGTTLGLTKEEWHACKPAHIKQAVLNALEIGEGK